MLEVGVTRLHPELATLVGRLRYRTSYGQNQLFHAIEVAYIASAIAAELNLELGDKMVPAVLRSAKSKDYLHLIMPLKV